MIGSCGFGEGLGAAFPLAFFALGELFAEFLLGLLPSALFDFALERVVFFVDIFLLIRAAEK